MANKKEKKPIEIKGTIEKVVRKVGKETAEVVLSIPTSQSLQVPLGPVLIQVQKLQAEMFEQSSSDEDDEEDE